MGLVQKSFSDIITFSRSSNATRVGPTGLVEYAPHNLLTYSEQFDNAAWITNNATITANSAASPSGSVTADKITEDSNNTDHKTRQASTFAGVAQTYSCYLKAAERTCGALQIYDGATLFGYIFDLANGVLGSRVAGSSSNVTGAIVSVGNGWYRCSITCTPAAGSGQVNIAVALNTTTVSYTGDGTSGIYIWGAQLAVGPYALDYTPTTSAAVYGPRFDYDGSGVTIVEPVSTNLVLYSQEFENGYWLKGSSSVTANMVAAPDGTVTADGLISAASGSGASGVFVTISGLSSGATYTMSCYIKSKGANWTQLIAVGTGGSQNVTRGWFNISTGAVGTINNTSSAGTIQNVGNGWYRCSMIVPALTTTAPAIYFACANGDGIDAFTNDGVSGLYIWGAQLEVGSTATGYMVSGATNGFRAVPVVSGSATARGLLVEEQRTNLLTYSEQFDNAAWNKVFTTITANATVSPDGTVNADKMIETAVTNIHYVAQTQAATNGNVYTTSVFLKAAERRYAIVDMTDALTGGVYVYVDLQTGTFSQAVVAGGSWTNPSASIVSFGNGWYRVSVTGTLGANNRAGPLISVSNAATGGETISYAGDGTSGIYIWGAQLE